MTLREIQETTKKNYGEDLRQLISIIYRVRQNEFLVWPKRTKILARPQPPLKLWFFETKLKKYQ